MTNLSDAVERVKGYEPLWDGWRCTGRLLGSGASGCVLELERGDERSVVKVITVEDSSDKYALVKNEIETMTHLRNKYLAECLDYRVEQIFNRRGELDGFDFLIHMHYYDSFADFLREEDYDPTALCVQMTLEIGIALCVLHSNGILHRDIKPANIFIDNSGDKPHFRLGDFGVSKKISDMSGLTATGTPDFMAPESFRYYEYSYRSDIYNFGITLYYILNDLSFPQFNEEHSQADIDNNILCRMRGDKFPEPVFGSERLKKVVLKCCEFQPKDRYADVSEMLSELFGQTIRHAGIRRKEDASPLRQKNKSRKLLPWALTAFAVTASAAAGVAVFSILSDQQPDPVEPTGIAVTEAATARKYTTAFIEKRVREISEDAERIKNVRSSNSIMDINGDVEGWIQPTGEAYIKVFSRDNFGYDLYTHYTEFFFDKDGVLFFVNWSHAGNTTQLFVHDGDIIRMHVKGDNFTYDYGDPKITDDYREVLQEGEKLYQNYIAEKRK